MKIEVNEDFRERIASFCRDELSWHIGEAASDYHEENKTEIELLFRLGKFSSAEDFYTEYLKALNQEIADEDSVYRKEELYGLKKDLKEFWIILTSWKKEILKCS